MGFDWRKKQNVKYAKHIKAQNSQVTITTHVIVVKQLAET